MASITLKGNACSTCGDLPAVGSAAPDSSYVKGDLSENTVHAVSGKKVLNIFPSIDTPVCAMTVRTFNEKAGSMAGVTVVNVSADLPFAHGRFCGAEGLEGVETGSVFRSSFADDFGVRIADGPLAGLCARAIVVVDENNKVIHSQLVPEITEEPDYDAALAVCG